MFDLKKELEASYLASEDAENKARAIETEIRQMPGAEKLLPQRRYGDPVDEAASAKNLTLRSLIAQNNPKLAAYLGIPSDTVRRQEEAEAARNMSIQAMQMRTESLRQANEEARTKRERAVHAGINQVTGRRHGY